MGRPRQTHCKRGHEFTPENTYISRTTGYRQCRACGRLRYDREQRPPWEPPPMPDDPVILAYAAGIIDGEGNISMRMQSNGAGRVYHTFMVRVANTDRRMVDWLTTYFGGTVHVRPGRGAQKESYHWSAASGVAGAMLEAIRPYLVTKAQQADVALAFRDTKKRANGSSGSYVTAEVFEYRESLRQQMLALNVRGVAS